MSAARRLRRQLSLPEMLLWRLLRVTRRELRFRKQHAIGPYVADFYCPSAKMVIEVDGATHDFTQDADCERDAYIATLGLKVIRIRRMCSPIPRQWPMAFIACARALLAPPPLSLAALRSPSPLLCNGEVLQGLI